MRKSLDETGAFGALLTVLSNAFHCLSQKLLIAKLHACGVYIPSLKLLHSYLNKQKQREKLNDTYSSRWKFIFRVLLFLIYGQLYICIYVCMCVCMHVCMYVLMSADNAITWNAIPLFFKSLKALRFFAFYILTGGAFQNFGP